MYNWDMSRLFREGEIVNIIESVLNRVYVLFVALSFWLIKPEAGQGQPEAGQPEAGQPEASQPEASQPEASQPEASEHISVYGLTLTEGWD